MPTGSLSMGGRNAPTLFFVFIGTLILSSIFWNSPGGGGGNTSGSASSSSSSSSNTNHHEEEHSMLMKTLAEFREQLAGVREEMKAVAAVNGGRATCAASGKVSAGVKEDDIPHHQGATGEDDTTNNENNNGDQGGTRSSSRSSRGGTNPGGTKAPFIRGKKLAHGLCKGPLTVPKLRVPLPGNKCPRAEKPPPMNQVLEHDPDPEQQRDGGNKGGPGHHEGEEHEEGATRQVPDVVAADEVEKSPEPSAPKSTPKPISSEWLQKAEEVFGEKDVELSPVQWEVFKVVHPLVERKHPDSEGKGHSEHNHNNNDDDQRFDFSVDWHSIIETPPSKGNRNVGLNTGMGNLVKKLKGDSNNDIGVGNLCAFSRGRGLYRYYEGRMAQDAYSFIKFLYNHMWKKKGWIAMPTAGTALGVLRHHGMYDHDDDLDLFVFPPLKYLLPPTLEERQKWEKHNEARLKEIAERGTDAPTPVPPPTPVPLRYNESRLDKRMRREGHVDLGVRNYSWPMTPMDTWRRVYDDFHEEFLKYQEENPEEDFQWAAPFGIRYFHRKEHITLHRDIRFEDYLNVRQDKEMRSCVMRYDSTNKTDTRKPFWSTKCEPMHLNLCLQPPQFLYETAKDGPASLFTLGGQHGAGKLCKCRFGPENSKEHFMMCPPDLLSFVHAWYGKDWCIQAGPVNNAAAARKYKSWHE